MAVWEMLHGLQPVVPARTVDASFPSPPQPTCTAQVATNWKPSGPMVQDLALANLWHAVCYCENQVLAPPESEATYMMLQRPRLAEFPLQV